MSPYHKDLIDPAREVQGRTLSANDYAISLLIAEHLGAVWGHCYENSYPAFFACPTLFDPNGLFIEGWIVFEDNTKIVLMEHGWLMSGHHIIDPTVVLVLELDQPVYYFPGVFRVRAELEALENEFFPHVRFENYGDDGMGHPQYCAAYEFARQKARLLLTGGKSLVEVRATMLESQAEEAMNEANGQTEGPESSSLQIFFF